MSKMQLNTLADLIYWSYANLAMAHDGVERGIVNYDRTSFIIRMRMYKGLSSGKMHIASLLDDERWKMKNGARCVYCGATDELSVDHLIPRYKGGTDNAENLVCCCKSCNSSKGKKDMLLWYKERGIFPPLLVLRRYLKQVYRYCLELGLMDKTLQELDDSALPFSLSGIPTVFPKCSELSLM